ncbi:MAG TPA: TIGR03435 family protein [Bryobacteraceae bacterium]|jgi:uncharacterized protein (TIGR03435 family)|nr:TIGR03435 family protein [Bryobacteraceae bacterium]
MLRASFAVSILCFAALAQQPKGPAFEVASVKPSAPPGAGSTMIGTGGGPGTPDPSRATYNRLTLHQLLAIAYSVHGYQVRGPAWLDTERSDIVAKVPPAATRDDAGPMLQNLLIERFKMAVHKETKEAPIYALLTAKNGPKLAESPKSAPPEAVPAPNERRRAAQPPRDQDGFPILRGGRGNALLFHPDGRLRLAGGHMTMAGLSSTLSVYVGRQVVDMTGLNGEYDYKLAFTPGGLAIMRNMPPPPPGAPDADAGLSLFTALQEQLGLKLEPRKGPVDFIVVDSAEKVPTEN